MRLDSIRRFARRTGTAFAVLAAAAILPAARPLLDQHQWDRSFALFARDSSVPWRTTTVRLETYSSAPVEFRAYGVDVADVIVAQRPQGRVLQTQGRRPVASWRFSPPPGYRVEGNTVALPLGAREGVFVIEARRGSAVEQVWVNRTRIGLVSKEAPQGLVVYATDLGSGRPVRNMRLLFLVGTHFEKRFTDGHGLCRWNGASRPRFVLAEWGPSRAFLSFLPQAPVPRALAVVRVDRAVVRGGEDVNIVGFARRLNGDHYVRTTGTARVSVILRGRTLAAQNVALDSAGAFVTRLGVPDVGVGGTASVLVTVAGAAAGTGLKIDSAQDVALGVGAVCGEQCRPDAPVLLVISAKHAGLAAANVPVSVRVVRYPHIFPPGTPDDVQESWAATPVLNTLLTTNANGKLRVTVPAAADGLPSTLGVEATAAGDAASASTRLVLPNSAAAVQIVPDHARVDVGQSVGVNVRAFAAADGAPLAGTATVVLSHGPNTESATAKLDASGRGRVLFRRPQFGENLITAHFAGASGAANDANSVTVEPQALQRETQLPSAPSVVVTADRGRYHPQNTVKLDAEAFGAQGQALLSIDDRHIASVNLVPVSSGGVHGAIPLRDPQGTVQAGVAFVRDGAIAVGALDLAIDGPGHERLFALEPDARQYQPGTIAHVAVRDGNSSASATTVIRLTDAVPSGSADFDSAGSALAVGGATTQNSAATDPPWHAWVSPLHSRARDLFTDTGRRADDVVPPELSDTASRVFLWRTERSGGTLDIPVPAERGRYVLSVIRMYDDGDVGASTALLVVS